MNVKINGFVVYVVVVSFFDGVVVDIDDFVEVVDDDLGDFVEFFEVEFGFVIVNKLRKGE